MKEILGDYESFIETANRLIDASGIARKELIFCDTLCYRVESNERYYVVKNELSKFAQSVDESTVNGRLIAVFNLKDPLHVPGWQRPVPYIELPQPKPDNTYSEGLDHAQFVTLRGLTYFRSSHTAVGFDEMGLSNPLNKFLKLSTDSVAIKFHDKHMGSVVELEKTLHEHR